MPNVLETRFYAIDHEDGPQFYMLVRGGHSVSCFLCSDTKTEADLLGAPTLKLSAYDAATVMWSGRKLDISAYTTAEGR